MHQADNILDVNAYIDKCKLKMKEIRDHKHDDDCRDTVKKDLEAKYNYWEDEYWLAVEEKNRIMHTIYTNLGLEYSKNN